MLPTPTQYSTDANQPAIVELYERAVVKRAHLQAMVDELQAALVLAVAEILVCSQASEHRPGVTLWGETYELARSIKGLDLQPAVPGPGVMIGITYKQEDDDDDAG